MEEIYKGEGGEEEKVKEKEKVSKVKKMHEGKEEDNLSWISKVEEIQKGEEGEKEEDNQLRPDLHRSK